MSRFVLPDWGIPMRKLLALASAVAVLAIGLGNAWAIGPSFDCAGTQRPGAQIICASPDLSQTELALMQAYYALRWQVGSSGWQALRQEDLNFQSQTLQQCGVPRNNQLPTNATELAACMQRAFERQRDSWMSRLVGPAAEEAARRLGDHVALQKALQTSGFLPATDLIDGVYGATTRTAISAWQHANDRPETGFLGDADATALLAGRQAPAPAAPPAAPAVVAPMLQPATPSGHASMPKLDIGEPTAESSSSLSALEDWLEGYWETAGFGGIVMVLGYILVAAGIGYMLRPPSGVGSGAARSSAPGTARSQVQRGPKLMFCGVLVAVCGACVAYGPTGAYEAVQQAVTSVFA